MYRKNIEDCRRLAKEKKGQCLSDVYVNCFTKMLWKCENGHEWITDYAQIQQGYWCFACGTKKLNIEDCRNSAKEKEGKCLSSKYENSQVPMLWRCKFEHEWEARYNDIRQKRWCPFCAGKNKSINDCKNIAQKNKGICLSDKYNGVFSKYLWRCIDGHEWFATFHNVDNGQWCPICCRCKSQKQLYEIIKKLFINCEVVYNFNGFAWLTTGKRKQEIDIFIKERKIAIEFDGGQHFKPVKFWGGNKVFEQTIKRDQNKNKLISEHPDNIKYFIRIPYWEKITEENVKQILIKNGVKI